MAITPAGLPCWSRTSDFSSYGGNVNKYNYASIGCVNPLTDVTAEQHARLCEDVAAAARTAAFAVFTVQCDDTTPGPPTVLACDMMTGVQLASYVGDAPPTGFPTFTRNGNGDVTATFETSYTDAYGVAQTLTIRHAVAGVHGTTTGMTDTVDIDPVDGEWVRVQIHVGTTGAGASNPKFTLEVAP